MRSSAISGSKFSNSTLRDMRLFKEDHTSDDIPVSLKMDYQRPSQKPLASRRRSNNFSLLTESEFKSDYQDRIDRRISEKQSKQVERSKVQTDEISARKSSSRPQTTTTIYKTDTISSGSKLTQANNATPHSYDQTRLSMFSSLTAAANSLLNNLTPKSHVTSQLFSRPDLEATQKSLDEEESDDSKDDDNDTIAIPRKMSRSPALPTIQPQRSLNCDLDSISVITQSKFAGACSITGLKPGHPNWINQDTFAIQDSKFGSKTASQSGIFIMLDGHGENGHLASRHSAQKLSKALAITEDIAAAFHVVHQDLVVNADFDVGCSGCTCVMLKMYSNREISIANLGDSRCVLARLNQNEKIEAVQLSTDHKPDNPSERKRIMAAGGRVGCRQVSVARANGPPIMVNGPSRVWYTHGSDTVGLAMSRSLGDAIVHKFGVSAIPEISEYKCDTTCQFILLATDGVWDVVENQTAVEIVHSFLRSSSEVQEKDAARLLCHYARSRWASMSVTIDDISCIVVRLIY